MENLFDASGRFLVSFPVWLIGHPDNTVNGLLKSKHPDGDISTPVFTDEDIAKRMLESCPMPESYVIRPIKQPLEFIGLLCVLEAKGFTHVLFDPAGSRGLSISISKVRTSVLTGSRKYELPMAEEKSGWLFLWEKYPLKKNSVPQE